MPPSNRLPASRGVKLPQRSHAELLALTESAETAILTDRPLSPLNDLFFLMSPFLAPLAIVSSLREAMAALEAAPGVTEAARPRDGDTEMAKDVQTSECANEAPTEEWQAKQRGASVTATPTRLDNAAVYEDPLEGFKYALQSAMMVELQTIPMYLYALWSIENQACTAAREIRAIVIQEMNHLVTAGNILVSIGGSPRLYTLQKDQGFPLWWPTAMLDREPALELQLMPLNQMAKEMFIKVEQSAEELEIAAVDREILLPGHYFSLGDFYGGLETRAEEVAKNHKFEIGLERQITKKDGHFAGKINSISSLENAKAAMEIIIKEGEGSDPTDPTSHLARFKRMELPENPRNMATSPQTHLYKDHESIYAFSRLFDASYTYLLLSIEAMWQTQEKGERKDLAGNIRSIMGDILTPIARWLSEQPFENGFAGPCFAYFDFISGEGGTKNALQQLKGLKDALTELPEELEDTFETIDALKPLPSSSVLANE